MTESVRGGALYCSDPNCKYCNQLLQFNAQPKAQAKLLRRTRIWSVVFMSERPSNLKSRADIGERKRRKHNDQLTSRWRDRRLRQLVPIESTSSRKHLETTSPHPRHESKWQESRK